jgi:hypothetical protein
MMVYFIKEHPPRAIASVCVCVYYPSSFSESGTNATGLVSSTNRDRNLNRNGPSFEHEPRSKLEPRRA